MEIIKVSTNLYRGDKINDIKEIQELSNNRKSVAFQVGGANKRWMVKPASWVLGWNYSDIQKYIMNNNMYKTLRIDEVVDDVEFEDDTKEEPNMKFKVGDCARVKPIEWYNINKDNYGDIYCSRHIMFLKNMMQYCGRIVTIKEVKDVFYRIEEDSGGYLWQDWMFEDEKVSVRPTNKIESHSDTNIEANNTSEELDLTKILEGCEGMTFYHSMFGDVKLTKIRNDNDFPLLFGGTSLTKSGNWTKNGVGDCLIFPSKDQRDWSKFVKPIPIDTPMMCNQSIVSGYYWQLQYYRGFHKGIGCSHEHHMVAYKKDITSENYYNYVIPFDKFDPNNIKESLKYNIQK